MKRIFIIVSLVLVLCGCYDYRELNDMSVVTGIGIDYKDNKYIVSLEVTKSIKDGDFFTNEELLNAVDNAIKNDKALHIFGLLSEGGVHSHITHLYAILELAKQKGLDAKEISIPMTYSGRYVAENTHLDGVCKLVINNKTNKIRIRIYGMVW